MILTSERDVKEDPTEMSYILLVLVVRRGTYSGLPDSGSLVAGISREDCTGSGDYSGGKTSVVNGGM